MPLIRKDSSTAPPTVVPTGSRGDLASPDTEMRWSAARRLATDPSSAAALGAALAVETDSRVRGALFTSLAHIQTPEAVAAVLPHIRSPDAAVRTGALDALNAMPKAAEDALPNLLQDPDPDVRLLVCDIVRRLPGPAATRYLCDLLAHETQANVCGAAVEALSEVGDDSALPVLAACAEKFRAEPFLAFSIQIATRRIIGDRRAPDPKTP